MAVDEMFLLGLSSAWLDPVIPKGCKTYIPGDAITTRGVEISPLKHTKRSDQLTNNKNPGGAGVQHNNTTSL